MQHSPIRPAGPPPRWWLLAGGLSTALPLLLEGLRLLNGAPFDWRGLFERAAFVGAVLLAPRLSQPGPEGKNWRRPLAVAGLAGLAGPGYAQTQATSAAWLALAAAYSLTIACERRLTHQRGLFYRWAVRGLLAIGVGAGAVAAGQVESNFADEEFFAAIQALELALIWLLLLGAVQLPQTQQREQQPMHCQIDLVHNLLKGVNWPLTAPRRCGILCTSQFVHQRTNDYDASKRQTPP